MTSAAGDFDAARAEALAVEHIRNAHAAKKSGDVKTVAASE